jgi:hypothetical protein
LPGARRFTGISAAADGILTAAVNVDDEGIIFFANDLVFYRLHYAPTCPEASFICLSFKRLALKTSIRIDF